ncbi:SHOCT domain-containing protein [Georgenia satyanarayanai]|uniref:SHOCT domain-containing protein n=1 Tax=Georgenia satyanarayanai TaxID=860221 RepID=UPI0012652321|nr:SHOCT domain-containing protein [Georgenia satyanarayanai]
MDFWASFWDIIWWFLWAFFFIAYLFALFSIITDLFRDRAMSGWGKAVWLVFLLVLPLVTALVYLIARGSGMAERSAEASRGARQQAEAYIRDVAGSSPAEEISRAKALLDSGAISRAEFDHLKSRALSTASAPARTDGTARV